MEPFKDRMNDKVIRQLSGIFKRVYADFDETLFLDHALKGLVDLELKERAHSIMKALDVCLPAKFSVFEKIIRASLHPSEDPENEGASFGPDGIVGMAGWAIADLVTLRGRGCPEAALSLLKDVTKRFSAEFAVRPFLDENTELTLRVFKEWIVDENRHVRRLASEGCRPRLPWGMQLRKFVADPAPVLALLEALKDDPEEYVRRSVANNLNDIAKDHPDLVAESAARWLEGADKNRTRLVKHACRTLIKQGHRGALAAFGYTPLMDIDCELRVHTDIVKYGECLDFEFTLVAKPANSKVVVDYAVHFVKANGSRSPKVFKWKDTALVKSRLAGVKRHAIKPITTRTYYAGEHRLDILVNGVVVASGAFELVM